MKGLINLIKEKMSKILKNKNKKAIEKIQETQTEKSDVKLSAFEQSKKEHIETMKVSLIEMRLKELDKRTDNIDLQFIINLYFQSTNDEKKIIIEHYKNNGSEQIRNVFNLKD